MSVRELIQALLDHPLDAKVYVGKGMGLVASVERDSNDGWGYVVVSP